MRNPLARLRSRSTPNRLNVPVDAHLTRSPLFRQRGRSGLAPTSRRPSAKYRVHAVGVVESQRRARRAARRGAGRRAAACNNALLDIGICTGAREPRDDGDVACDERNGDDARNERCDGDDDHDDDDDDDDARQQRATRSCGEHMPAKASLPPRGV